MKGGHFALTASPSPHKWTLTPVQAHTVSEKSHVISAHYIPFVNGTTDLPGYADIPKHPRHGEENFVFTPGMNGCALQTHQHPLKQNEFRIYTINTQTIKGCSNR